MSDDDDRWSHLGDGVYVAFDGWGLVLHANDHKDPTDRIYLEPEVMRALVRKAEKEGILSKETLVEILARRDGVSIRR